MMQHKTIRSLFLLIRLHFLCSFLVVSVCVMFFPRDRSVLPWYLALLDGFLVPDCEASKIRAPSPSCLLLFFLCVSSLFVCLGCFPPLLSYRGVIIDRVGNR